MAKPRGGAQGGQQAVPGPAAGSLFSRGLQCTPPEAKVVIQRNPYRLINGEGTLGQDRLSPGPGTTKDDKNHAKERTSIHTWENKSFRKKKPLTGDKEFIIFCYK
jgi:hypothetical protein